MLPGIDPNTGDSAQGIGPALGSWSNCQQNFTRNLMAPMQQNIVVIGLTLKKAEYDSSY